MAHIDYDDGSYYDGNVGYDGRPDGYGVFYNINVGVYSGNFRNGEINGSGTLRYFDGSFLEGEFSDGEIHGNGRFVDSDYSYIGEFYYGKKQGHGHEHWSDGTDYQGTFYDDKREGQGVLKYGDGSTYTGDFLDNERHGKGRFVFDNYTYDGTWYRDQRHGECHEHWSDSNISFDGTYSYDERGYGTYRYPDGGTIEGPNKNGVSNGRCRCTSANGNWYEAEFVDDELKDNQRIEYHFIKNGTSKWYLYQGGEWTEL